MFKLLAPPIKTTLSHKKPLRFLLLKKILEKINSFPYWARLLFDAVPCPAYAYCIFNAALLAKSLGYREISIIEFGVGEGAGLLAIEKNIEQMKKEIDIEFKIYGFDLGHGLPVPLDYRDQLYHFAPGEFKMDLEKLKANLGMSELVLGNVKDMCVNFFENTIRHPSDVY